MFCIGVFDNISKTQQMKLNHINLLGTMLVLFYAISCSTDEAISDQEITSADIDEIRAIVSSGDWEITYYFDSDSEETDDYQGYSFTFNSDGVLAATDGNTALSGSWSITDSNSSNDDSGSSDIDFNILFSSPAIFEELSDDWDIIKYSNSKFELRDISGGDGSTDLLTFEKN